jgi:hypothetical protein
MPQTQRPQKTDLFPWYIVAAYKRASLGATEHVVEPSNTELPRKPVLLAGAAACQKPLLEPFGSEASNTHRTLAFEIVWQRLRKSQNNNRSNLGPHVKCETKKGAADSLDCEVRLPNLPT